MVADIAYQLIFGKPLIFWLGIITYLSFSSTALVGYLNYHHIRFIPFKYHPLLALTSLTLATIHGILGLSLYLGF